MTTYNGAVYRRLFIKTYGTGPYDCADCGVSVPKIGRCKGEGHVHHKNHNHDDNRIENLELLCWVCHVRHHRNWVASQTPEINERRRQARIGWKHSEETKRKMSAAATKRWADR